MSYKPELSVRNVAGFIRHIDLPTKEGCWNFVSVGANGYGNFQVRWKTVSAHRYSYEYFYGMSPGGDCVLHSCDNPLCVRPDHLFLGTNKDNSIDASKKGRLASGERNGNKKFTREDVAFMRKKYDSGEMRTTDIARHFSCKPNTITMIVRRHNWKHLEVSA